MDIDLVYAWVDGNDLEWQKEKHSWELMNKQAPAAAMNQCRFLDNQELKYSLRSVFVNAPWINKIYIITNGQTPKWLNINHPKIKIINHKDIMPEDALPTFNSEAIECCIPNIEGLSEHFIYSNDDFFINKPIEKNFFFNENGEPIIRLVPQKWKERNYIKNLYCHNINYSIELIKSKFNKEYNYEICHNMDAYRKSYFYECEKEFQKEFNKTKHAKFREKNSVQRIIVSLYTLAKNNGELRICKMRSKHFHIETAYIALSDRKRMRKRIKTNNPSLFCINDNERAKYIYRKNLSIFLESLFPIRAPWENDLGILKMPIKTNNVQHKFKYITHYLKIYLKYKIYKLLSVITNGKIRTRNIGQCEYFREKIRIIRDL